MTYNVLHGLSANRRPAKGQGILDRSCCFTCSRLSTEQGYCPFRDGQVPDALLWGEEQCHGYTPRQPEDYRVKGSASKTADGAVIAAPGEQREKKAPTRQVVVIVPPPQEATIIPPERGLGLVSGRGTIHLGSGASVLDPSMVSDMGDNATEQDSGKPVLEEDHEEEST